MVASQDRRRVLAVGANQRALCATARVAPAPPSRTACSHAEEAKRAEAEALAPQEAERRLAEALAEIERLKQGRS
jgi:hypothetical protein